MKYMLNPTTHVIREVSPLEAKRLSAYSWIKSDAAAYWTYKRQLVQAEVERMAKKGELRLRLN